MFTPLGPLSKGKKGPVSREARFSGHSCRIRCPASNGIFSSAFSRGQALQQTVTWQQQDTTAETGQARQ